MPDSKTYLMDCMEAMRSMPDNAFDLAVVDPVYGDVTKGGYITGKSRELPVAFVPHWATCPAAGDFRRKRR